jgi:hypothetical protein
MMNQREPTEPQRLVWRRKDSPLCCFGRVMKVEKEKDEEGQVRNDVAPDGKVSFDDNLPSYIIVLGHVIAMPSMHCWRTHE